MQRELKYMYWDGSELVKNFEITSTGHLFLNGHGGRDNSCKLKNLMEYIGKKDDNDQDMFTGHIILVETRTGHKSKYIVVWCSYSCSYGLESVNKINGESLTVPIHFPMFKKLEIIGNIYQDPELLIHGY